MGAGEEREFNFSIGRQGHTEVQRAELHSPERMCSETRKKQVSSHICAFARISCEDSKYHKVKGFLRQITEELKIIVYLFIHSRVPRGAEIDETHTHTHACMNTHTRADSSPSLGSC